MGKVGTSVITLISVAILGVVTWLWGAQIFRYFWTEWRPASPIIILFVVALIFFGVSAFRSESRTSKSIAGPAVIGVVVVLAAVFLWFKLPYDTNRQYVADMKYAESSESVSFDERAPFVVANRSSSSYLENTTGEEQATKSVADEGENGNWNTLVTRRGFNVGYESVQSIEAPLYGTVPVKNVTLCDFNPNASKRIGGLFPHNSIEHTIYWSTPINVNFAGGDAYSYCDGDTPYVVFPLKTLEGFYAPQWNAYGVALYNGTTGETKIITDTESLDKIPGPVYPITLAHTQRQATHASGSWGDYIFGITGYEDTSDDEEDPNGGNNSEFLLRETDSKDIKFVTPLTPRGDSVTIVGLSTVDANTVKSGTRNPLVIHPYKDGKTRQANSATVDDISTNYSWMPEMSSSKIQIFEVVPAGNNEWVASIGRKQSVAYRAVIDADRNITLYNKDGNIVTQSNPAGAPEETPSEGAEETVKVDVLNVDLDTLTPEQLKELGKLILDEIGERIPTE